MSISITTPIKAETCHEAEITSWIIRTFIFLWETAHYVTSNFNMLKACLNSMGIFKIAGVIAIVDLSILAVLFVISYLWKVFIVRSPDQFKFSAKTTLFVQILVILLFFPLLN